MALAGASGGIIPRRSGRALARRYAHVPLLAPAVALSVAVFWVCMAVLLLMSVYPFLAAGTPKFTLAGAAVVTVLGLLIGYPAAYAMSKIQRPGWALAAYLILFAPILVSMVVRTYGWLLLLSNTGVINFLLRTAGLG